MYQYFIETIDGWNNLMPRLLDGDYRLFQTQYGIDSPEGAIWRFMSGPHVIEVTTHSQAVYDTIRRFVEEQD